MMHNIYCLLAIAQFTIGFYLLFELILALVTDYASPRVRHLGRWMADLLRLP
jgi:hypothetical protein